MLGSPADTLTHTYEEVFPRAPRQESQPLSRSLSLSTPFLSLTRLLFLKPRPHDQPRTHEPHRGKSSHAPSVLGDAVVKVDNVRTPEPLDKLLVVRDDDELEVGLAPSRHNDPASDKHMRDRSQSHGQVRRTLQRKTPRIR